MESSFFTIVFFLESSMAPLVRLPVTIIGNISGVKPIATDKLNNKDSNQASFKKPFIKNTIGTIKNINLIRSFETSSIPFSKLVSDFVSCKLSLIVFKNVCFPVLSTTPTAAPLRTLVPIKTILDKSEIDSVLKTKLGYFSTGVDSPVKTD